MQKKTSFAVVDKRRFFYGRGGGIRTHAYSSQSAVSYRLTTPLDGRAGVEPARYKKTQMRYLRIFACGVDEGIRTPGLQGHNLTR